MCGSDFVKRTKVDMCESDFVILFQLSVARSALRFVTC